MQPLSFRLKKKKEEKIQKGCGKVVNDPRCLKFPIAVVRRSVASSTRPSFHAQRVRCKRFTQLAFRALLACYFLSCFSLTFIYFISSDILISLNSPQSIPGAVLSHSIQSTSQSGKPSSRWLTDHHRAKFRRAQSTTRSIPGSVAADRQIDVPRSGDLLPRRKTRPLILGGELKPDVTYLPRQQFLAFAVTSHVRHWAYLDNSTERERGGGREGGKGGGEESRRRKRFLSATGGTIKTFITAIDLPRASAHVHAIYRNTCLLVLHFLPLLSRGSSSRPIASFDRCSRFRRELTARD